MLIYLLILGSIYIVSVAEGFGLTNEPSWTYEIKSIECKSEDTDLMEFTMTKERISRGVYATSGEVFIKFDIVAGDGNTFSITSYRSPMGDGNYKITPVSMAPIHWIEFLNTQYKDTIMESAKDCSNLPYFEDKFVGPLVKNKYILNKCQVSQEGFPNYIQEGMYKIEVNGTGTVNWYLEIIVDVQSNY